MRDLDIGYDVVADRLRTSLERLLRQAAPPPRHPLDGFIGLTSRWSGPLRIPAVVEIEATGRPGRIHLRWWAGRMAAAYPVMEAELALRALSGGRSQLTLTGEYVPPFGGVGALGDLLVGRHVARSTAEALLDSLVAALGSGEHGIGARKPGGRQPPLAQQNPDIRDHEALLTMARKVRAAAQDRDWERFHSEMTRLRGDLRLHLAGEAHDLSQLPEPDRDRLERGQDELLALVEELSTIEAETPGTNLALPTGRFVAALAYQREQERRALSGAA